MLVKNKLKRLLMEEIILVEKSGSLSGEVKLSGAKNAVLVIMASLLLVKGRSILKNVPDSSDVEQMIKLLVSLGVKINFDPVENILEADTSNVENYSIDHTVMRKMRASILVMGPLLARLGRITLTYPGGCVIGMRPIDYHIKNFKRMGVVIHEEDSFLKAATDCLQARRLVLEYPSVGATENLIMAATLTEGVSQIVNAAVEPEVLDLIEALKKMGAKIEVITPATIVIEGVAKLNPIEYSVMNDRLEAGTLLLAAAVTGGEIMIPGMSTHNLDVFLLKLEEMGHIVKSSGDGISLKAAKYPRAVSFKTAPYPGFPTDLQAPMMVAQCLAEGTSVIEEAVFENRLIHILELQKMGAQIKLVGNRAHITGVSELYGADVIASDIRAAAALVIAGLAAQGKTMISGVHHFKRGYDKFDKKLLSLGAKISLIQSDTVNLQRSKQGLEKTF
jgi:UDP-N-acetylglucosamine 1-carboxyvinyltransferase